MVIFILLTQPLFGYWNINFYDISTSMSSGITTQNTSHNFGTSNLYLLTALEVYNVNNNSDVCGTINFHNMVLNYQSNHVGMVWAGQFGSGSPVTGLYIITYGTDNSRVTLGTPN
jgi:hypothetical protein